jgi:hypothetical protein
VQQASVLRSSRTFFSRIEGDVKRTYGAQKQADFSPWFPLLHFHDPLSADADFLSQRLLVEAKLGAVVADKSPEIGWRSNAHFSPTHKMSAYDDIISKSVISDN